MDRIDPRDLFAQNLAAIAAAGVPVAGTLAPAATDVAATPAGLWNARRPVVHEARRRRGPTVGSARPVRAPVGEPRTFTVAGRARRALVHAPSKIGAEPAPLLCLLHGCTQDPASFAAATRIAEAADRHGFAVVLPGQERGDNAMGCWNWFEAKHRTRGRGEPGAIAGIVAQLLEGSDLRIDAGRVFACGLSSGGAMAAILAATYPDLFAAVAVHSGLPFAAASDVGSAHAAMARGGGDPENLGRAAHAAMGSRARAVPTMVVHGTADRTVAPVNAQGVLRQAMAANRRASAACASLDPARPATVSPGRVDGGHAYTRSRWHDARGALVHELLLIEGLGHAWSGGLPGGSYTDPRGPNATDAVLRFFTEVAATATA